MYLIINREPDAHIDSIIIPEIKRYIDAFSIQEYVKLSSELEEKFIDIHDFHYNRH